MSGRTLPGRGHRASWRLGPSASTGRKRTKQTRFWPYPCPSRLYRALPVFDHPGILHRNSRTKSRAIAPSLVVRLKRRDRSCPGDDLGPESLGDGVSRPASLEPRRGRREGVEAPCLTNHLPLPDTTSSFLRWPEVAPPAVVRSLTSRVPAHRLCREGVRGGRLLPPRDVAEAREQAPVSVRPKN